MNMRDSTSESTYIVPAGWRARVLGTYECQGTTYHEIEMVPNRWDWRYWLGRLRMRFARWEEGTVSE
jgi:hypothetical protein